MKAPDPALVERFRADLEALTGPDIGHDASFALAVSGGSDSMAMLALAHAALPGRILAATVDHRLRRESAAEARMVTQWCAERDIPHQTFVPASAIAGSGVQAQARAARYDLLARWTRDIGATALLTGHQADDQAETLLMRLARGVGIAGMRGIPAFAALGDPAVPVLRPLLGWMRAELRAVAAGCGIPFVTDPSNDDDAFERVRVRKLLASADWLDPRMAARTASRLAEVDTELTTLRDWLWENRARPGPRAGAAAPALMLDVSDLPRELKRRLARRAIREVRGASAILQPDFSEATNIEPLLDALEAGTAATHAAILVTPEGRIWHFKVAPPRRSL